METLLVIIIYFLQSFGIRGKQKKSFLLHSCKDQSLKESMLTLFPYNYGIIEEGFRYLGFLLKPNGYGPKNWEWNLKCIIQKTNS